MIKVGYLYLPLSHLFMALLHALSVKQNNWLAGHYQFEIMPGFGVCFFFFFHFNKKWFQILHLYLHLIPAFVVL